MAAQRKTDEMLRQVTELPLVIQFSVRPMKWCAMIRGSR
eukprot:IDg18367t1